MRYAILVLGLSLFLTLLPGVQAGGEHDPGDREEIKQVTRGAIQDDSWMQAESRREVDNILSRYFTGALLQEKIDAAWDFARQDTDWYTRYIWSKISIQFIDSREAKVLVFVKEKSAVSKKEQSFTLTFWLEKKTRGWRVSKMSSPE